MATAVPTLQHEVASLGGRHVSDATIKHLIHDRSTIDELAKNVVILHRDEDVVVAQRAYSDLMEGDGWDLHVAGIMEGKPDTKRIMQFKLADPKHVTDINVFFNRQGQKLFIEVKNQEGSHQLEVTIL